MVERSLQEVGKPIRSDIPIVGIGASAGGLEACRRMLDAFPAKTGMAFILVQHLEPHHESMMVDLLAEHTAMAVREAEDGLRIVPDTLYIIPPGVYLAVADNLLRLSRPRARHGRRMPFDFLLESLAEACGPHTACIVLSGTGADGSLGLAAVSAKGGLVIAQDPEEASFDGMPRAAIATGKVDLVLRVAEIPNALSSMAAADAVTAIDESAAETDRAWLAEIIELLRSRTAYDFRLYKPGTLERRVERRMTMAIANGTGERGAYLDLLRRNPAEIDRLAADLLINVTGFFRDREVFDLLAETAVPELVRVCGAERAIRVWSAGCSTGEETYSLAILFLEEIALSGSVAKLQMFASDVDPDAIAVAREGLYPKTIAASVPPERLGRFFTEEDQGYRVSPDLRATVVFTVQDILSDPPFSRLDLISCRNLLIYLGPEAQARVISIFHFALRDGGMLLLGNSETVGTGADEFTPIAKVERLYRHVGRGHVRRVGFPLPGGDMRLPIRAEQRPTIPSRTNALAELCRRVVIGAYAPATVLTNRKGECLYYLGPIDRYLQVVPGAPAQDVLAMAREEVRGRLRSALRQVSREVPRISVEGGRIERDGAEFGFRIDVQEVVSEGEPLMVISFVDEPQPPRTEISEIGSEAPGIAELEQEIEATRHELQAALHSLDVLGEEQRAINEEASSVQEEYQSTNEELMTSKEELQSLNEELRALNTQLHETLERQRTTSNDLQNVLYSTNVATIFLDRELRIRFFTPATKALFNILPGDVGRPLSDLSARAIDSVLLSDARAVLHDLAPVEREIEIHGGTWYLRRVVPYLTEKSEVEGVVVTFVDSTGRKHSADALDRARRHAQQANAAKSRFLAAASHDLRQPLQTLALLHGLLAKTVEGEKGLRLVTRLDETMAAISGMLNALLDINQLEAGTVQPKPVDFPIDDLFSRMRTEFAYHAEAQGLSLRVVTCGLCIHSDPRLLEQMIRNLLSNALKYTREGKVLLGCRRTGKGIRIEIRDTGIGIPEGEFQAIFEEYHQVGNVARKRSTGLGLGLSIVQRLAKLLDHRLTVRSRLGRGSVFAIEVNLAEDQSPTRGSPAPRIAVQPEVACRRGTVLVIEDDPGLRELLTLSLQTDGHHVAAAADGTTAFALIEENAVRPDVLLADYNLPDGRTGIEVVLGLRERCNLRLPAVILTGDVSTASLRDVAAHACTQVSKPVQLAELLTIVRKQLAEAATATPEPPRPAGAPGPPVVYIVDDDVHLRAAVREILEAAGRIVLDFATAEAFLAAHRPGGNACLLVDAYLPGMSGLDLLRRIHETDPLLQGIMITGSSDVALAVKAMKAGAIDFIEKPIGGGHLLGVIDRAFEQARDAGQISICRQNAAALLARLTPRQRQILSKVLAGHPSKNIAADLGISQRTVENHRAAIMSKTGAKSLPALARLAVAAGDEGDARS